MPFHNFMLADIAGCLLAISLFALFLFIPGYAAAWALDLFEFRTRSWTFRAAAAVPLGIAFCPILTYLAGRFASMRAVSAIYAIAALYFLTTLRRARISRLPRMACIAAAVWLAVALYSMVDFQLGDRLYFPTGAIDHSLRSAFIHSISATGIPPQNPLFWPGHAVTLRYHYFWFMMCSLVDQAGGAAVSPRQSLMGGTFWCGLGLIGLLALYLRLHTHGGAPLPRRLRIGILLLGITGLDLLPSLWFLMLHFRAGLEVVLPSVEWWNEHVDWFLYSAVWAPHALAAMIAGFIALLLLSRGSSPRYIVSAGVALASAAGCSIYVAFVFAIFLAVWTLVTILKKWHAETRSLVAAGALSVLLVFPYLSDLRGPGAGGPLFAPTVRTFSLAALIPNWGGMSPLLRALLVNVPLIPVNYMLELGFFFAIGWIRWREYRRSGRTLDRAELAAVTLALTSILICTFLKSSVIGCNDLGWRGFLPAEFILLLWAVDILSRWKDPGFLSENQKSLLMLCLAIGAAGTLYDLAIVRLHPMLADAGRIPPLDWMALDHQIGKRTYANRAAYEWAHRATPETATFQFNPKVVFEEAYSMYYSERRNLAGDMECHTVFGGDPSQCRPLLAKLQQIYPPDPQRAPTSLRDACSAVPADMLVAKDTDPVWKNRASWVWSETPAYANDYIRLFPCPRGADDRSAALARELQSGFDFPLRSPRSSAPR